MIDHSSDAFEHNSFKDVVVKVANLEIYYKSINFYMAEQPQLINDLLNVFIPRIDISRVVKMFQRMTIYP